MGKCVGMVLHKDRVEAAEISGAASDFRVIRWGRASVTGNGSNGPQAAALASLFHDLGLPRDPVAAGIPASAAIVRALNVPFRKHDQIRKILKTEASEHIHGHSVENVVLSFHKTGDSKDGARIIMMGMPKETMSVFMSTCAMAGIDPQTVALDLPALFNLGSALGIFRKGAVSVLVNVEPNSTGFLVSRDGEMALVRPVKTALDSVSLPPTVPANPGPEPLGAQGGDQSLPPALESGAIEAAAGTIAREVKRSLLSASIQFDSAAFYVSGCFGGDETFRKLLAEALGAQVARLEDVEARPGTRVSALAEGCGVFPALAVGLALKGIGTDLDLVDFRQGEFAFQRKFDRIKTGLCFMSACVLILLCVLGFYLDSKIKVAREEHKKIAKAALDLCTRIIPVKEMPAVTRQTAVPAIKKLMSSRLEELVGKGTDRDVPQISSVLTYWSELASRVESASGVRHLDVEKIQITQTSFSISGVIDSPVAIDSILNKLKTYQPFSRAETYSPPKKTDDGLYTFDIRGEIQGGQ